jgi:hypothetical protein
MGDSEPPGGSLFMLAGRSVGAQELEGDISFLCVAGNSLSPLQQAGSSSVQIPGRAALRPVLHYLAGHPKVAKIVV